MPLIKKLKLYNKTNTHWTIMKGICELFFVFIVIVK